jgi:GxxExxY protein
MNDEELAAAAVEAAFRVHRELGPGLLENAYTHCMFHELREMQVEALIQHPLPLVYKNVRLDAGYRLDLWLERKVIVELKAVDALHPIHSAQLMTYLKLTNNRLGLLINFNVKRLKDGIERWVNGY